MAAKRLIRNLTFGKIWLADVAAMPCLCRTKFFRLMKHALLVAAFFALNLNLLNAQTVVWNKELPVVSFSQSNCAVQQIGDRILFCAQKSLIEMNAVGAMTGAVVTPAATVTQYSLGHFVREKIDPKTGERYFLLVYRTLNAGQPVVFAEYRPGAGFVNSALLPEGGASSNVLSPAVVEIDDSTFAVFGRKYARQVTHRPGQGVVLNWERPYYQGNVNAAIRTDDGDYITATQSGNILALTEQGDSLWKTVAGFAVRNMKKTAQGFVVCGLNSSNQAVIAEYSNTGTLLWVWGDVPDQSYEYVMVESDGGLMLTGQTTAKEILLLRLSADGTPLWRKTYQQGTGGNLFKAADGGYLLGAALKSSPSRFCLIKTDPQGNTGVFEPALHAAYRKLENSQILVQSTARSSLFFDAISEEAKFVLPKDSLIKLFFNAGLWLGGLDADSVLHLATSIFNLNNRSDFRSGLSYAPTRDFSRAWRASRTEIQAFRQDWADNGKIDQPIPHDILTWPAKGNPYFTQNLDFSKPLTDKALLPAPFTDVNGDGLYSPTDGDYPRIKGDQMIWWVMTDSILHTESGGRPLAVDVSTSVYLYECGQNGLLENTLFVDYEVLNRSGKPYFSMFASLWSDPDLGCPQEDYIGCLPLSDAYFIYNQDAIDGLTGSLCSGAPTFGSEVPVASATMLNKSLDRFSYFNNSAPQPIEPTQDFEFYRLMQGIVYSGSMGFDTIEFAYPGNPADPDGESMCSANVSPGDRRTLGSTGPFTLAPNDTFRLSVAFTYHPDIPHPCPDIYGSVKNDIDQLRSLANSGALEGPAQLPASVKLLAGQSVTLDASVPGATAYQWSNGSTSAQISVTQPGIYTVTITKATGCQSVEIVTVKSASGAQGPNGWPHQFRLYPNPNTGQFRVEMSGPAQAEVEFSLFNAVGQLIRRDVEGFGTGRLARSFDYGQLPSGVYALRMQAGNEAMWVKVVVER
jgi:hypothetical protein